ncbi:hypothetical protein FKM82_019359 [Ascaphus truei]
MERRTRALEGSLDFLPPEYHGLSSTATTRVLVITWSLHPTSSAMGGASPLQKDDVNATSVANILVSPGGRHKDMRRVNPFRAR